jgi:hypothetical protein
MHTVAVPGGQLYFLMPPPKNHCAFSALGRPQEIVRQRTKALFYPLHGLLMVYPELANRGFD